MIFNSFSYLIFFPVVTLLYFVLPRKIRWVWLLVSSYYFYMNWHAEYALLMAASTLVTYICALAVSRIAKPKARKAVLVGGIVFNLGMLGYFKYTGMFIDVLNRVCGALGFALRLPQVDILLPVGISFFTFQIISYVIDCHWEKVQVQHNFFNLLMYISLFPQLIAGPIVRYETIEREVSERKTTLSDFSDGLTRFIVGLAKKAIIANNLSIVVDKLFGLSDGVLHVESSSIAGVWVGVICFALYVYYDFSGYSDMAIGMGWMLGFHFDENFRYPFVSRSIAEFWQRWHISLGTFFRDYLLYVPIFGKRRKYVSLFLVWFCTGFWHGASWNYIFWGLYFGCFIFLETLIGKKRMKRIPAPLAHLYSLLVIVIGFGIFKFENLTDLGLFFKGLVGANGNPFLDPVSETAILQNMFLILGAALLSMPILPKIKNFVSQTTTRAAVAGAITTVTNVGLLVVSSIMLIDTTNNPFLYFRF